MVQTRGRAEEPRETWRPPLRAMSLEPRGRRRPFPPCSSMHAYFKFFHVSWRLADPGHRNVCAALRICFRWQGGIPLGRCNRQTCCWISSALVSEPANRLVLLIEAEESADRRDQRVSVSSARGLLRGRRPTRAKVSACDS